MNSDFNCSICGISCTGLESFLQHKNSAKHQKKVAFHQAGSTNLTMESTLADNNLQLFSCNLCNVQLRGFGSFHDHVNSLQHADMVRMTSSGNITTQNQSEATPEKTDIAEVNTVSNPGTSLPYEGYNSFLGSYGHCVICKMQFSGPEQQQQHLAGKSHKKKLKLLELSAQITQTEGGSAKNDIPNGSTSSDIKCETCQLLFSGPIPYQQHLVGEGHRKKTMQRELMAVKLSFDTVDSDKIMPFIQIQEKATGNDTILCPKEKGSCIDSEDNQPFAKCTFCDTEFTGPESYQLHVESIEHQAKIRITVDSDKIPFIQNLEAAGNDTILCPNEKRSCMDSEDNQPFAKCTICNMEFTGPEPYQLHVESIEHQKKIGIQPNSVNVFKCDICNIPLSGPIPYKEHMNSLKHQKKVQNVEFLKQFKTNKSPEPVCTQPDKINGAATSVNSEYYCEVCDIKLTGPEPYRQHIYGMPHKKKERASNSFGNVGNVNHFQNGFSEKNDLNPDLKTNFYLSNDLILCDGLKNMGDSHLEKLNVQVFYPDDEIVFDKPIKKDVVSDL
ncbi:hypothetical protein JTE90_009407 [Oedothorax gibbosus]|uniref:C2H2-type domain-containing protein n=1 Tax=Oedothorax gibbosus TaxID=931172 RepID=A0AAV6VU49_9ARAC|nr:hypothetical protein JTE90_009407 [Oedothorax gibbosus]